MKIKYLLSALLLSTLVGCGGGGSDSGDGGDGIIKFSVLLSAGCSGTVGKAEVFFDDRKVGELVPGSSLSVDTVLGEHTVEGLGNTGTKWLRHTIVIEFDGQSQTFTCT